MQQLGPNGDARVDALRAHGCGRPGGGGGKTIWSPELLRRRASAAADGGTRRQRATVRGEGNGRHREVRLLTWNAEDKTATPEVFANGRGRARRWRRAAEVAAKFASPGPSLLAWLTEEEEETTEQLQGQSPELGVARRCGTARRP